MKKQKVTKYTPMEVIVVSPADAQMAALDMLFNKRKVALFCANRCNNNIELYSTKGVYALCEADTKTLQGLNQALFLVRSQIFDTLVFASGEEADDNEDIQLDRHQLMIVKEAAYTGVVHHNNLRVSI